MSESLSAHENFVAVKVYDAVYKTAQEEKTITLEIRTKSDRTTSLFTVIDDQEIRSTSIPSLLLTRPDCISLSISHVIALLWHDTRKRCTLTEIFVPSRNDQSHISIKIELTIDEKMYASSICISFTEAMLELHDIIGSQIKWRLVTCYGCKYSRPAFLGPTSDRDELRCYRDVPKEFEEIEHKAKVARSEALFAGDFFVDVFHKCAAWHPTKLG